MVATKRGLAEAEETPQAKLAHFALSDNEGRWQPASAVIKDRTVTVTSERVPSPVAVRYAYAVNPQGCNLYNRDGLPASPFCSDPTLLDYAPRIALGTSALFNSALASSARLEITLEFFTCRVFATRN